MVSADKEEGYSSKSFGFPFRLLVVVKPKDKSE
jgi:hypothetical protein